MYKYVLNSVIEISMMYAKYFTAARTLVLVMNKQDWCLYVRFWFELECTVMCVTLIAVVAQLLSKEFVEFMQNKYYIRAVPDSASAAGTHTENYIRAVPDSTTAAGTHTENMSDVDASESTSLEPLVIKVSDIPRQLSEKVVQMILENKRFGGGTMRRMEFSDTERSAVIEYEERTGKSVDLFVGFVVDVCTLSQSLESCRISK